MAQNVEAWTLLALALVVIIIRIYVRWSLVGPKGFQLDDYLMPLAGIVFVLETVAAYLVGANYEGLTNSYISPSERQAIVPNSKEWNNRVAGSKIQVLGWSLYVAILWLVKFALAVFYSRLTTGLQNLPQRVRIAYVILGVTWLATQLSLLLSCQPFHAFWQINPDPGDVCQPAKSPVYVLVVVLLNIVTDLYLLSIPLPLLWQVKISLKQKIPLMGLFSGAAFVITASIIRAVMISVAGPEGAVAGSKWACRETFVSIVVSNLPIIQPLIRRGFKKIGLSQLFSSSGKESNGRSYPLSSRGRQTLASHADRITKKGKHAQGLTQTQVSAWGSDEHILTSPEPTSKEITVVSETIVQTEQWNRDREPQPTRVSSPNQWDARGTTHAV
ncbi:Uncharacterized protein PECH_006315 [Penicillium ucsense]|uniref:Rhodopsin domain-containing protein n=1 Tax=Penicillium ucsense TaxID=2839758 RepID=A0A8J8W6J9_9EURO|nr:Uncharacterized protein PECM_000358 [Penicillium ucsense]KAF7739110.1 Uncharacterized protein PECH_006315 [Penicillium ucsense]